MTKVHSGLQLKQGMENTQSQSTVRNYSALIPTAASTWSDSEPAILTCSSL
jgi:hypothetical protein